MANVVASLIDYTCTGIGSYALLCPNGNVDDDDDIVEQCGELSYLDVTDPTIKSRLVVSAVGDDEVEECLGIGVTKYVIAGAVEGLEAVAGGQGKQLVLQS